MKSRAFVKQSLFVLFIAVFGVSSAKSGYSPKTIPYDASRLTNYSTAELIDLLSEGSLTRNASANGIFSLLPPDKRESSPPPQADSRLFVGMEVDSHAVDYTIAVEQELIKRSPYALLSRVFATTTDRIQAAWAADVLTRMRGPEADSVLRPFTKGQKDDDRTYFALKYFASACDTDALRILNRNYFQYPTSSLEWASIVRSFGNCKYKPAVPNLVQSVNAMMINLGYASHQALLSIYPDANISFDDPGKAQGAWERYLKTHR